MLDCLKVTNRVADMMHRGNNDQDNNIAVYTITVPNNTDVPEVDRKESGPPLEAAAPISTMPRRRALCWSLLVDVPIVLSVITLIALVEFGVFPHNRLGFYCNDPALSFPYGGDTISMTVLLVSCILGPVVVIWIVEALIYTPNEYPLKTRRFVSSLSSLWFWYREYLFGLTLNTLITESVKLIAGEPRPHFFYTCQPDTASQCTGSPNQYISSYTCTNIEETTWFVSDSSKSFLSGHTSLAIYMSLVMTWYLQRRAWRRCGPVLFVPLVQVLLVVWGLGCGLTRITDHRHHWWDVLAGLFLGVATAVYTITMLCKNFTVPSPSTSRDSISNSDSSAAHNHNSVRRLLSATSSVKDDERPVA